MHETIARTIRFFTMSPPDFRTVMVEQIRSSHEEIEKLEQLVMEVLKTEEPSSPMKQLLQGHRLRSITKSIILKTEKLVFTYETNDVAVKEDTISPIRILSYLSRNAFPYPLKPDGEIKDEIAPIPADQTATWTNVSSAFFNRLKEILEYHRNHHSGLLVVADEDYEVEEPVIAFSGEEGFGRFLDLHDMYNQYINSNFGERVEYSAYLDLFSQPEKIPSQLKLSRQYTEYLEALLEYLIYFFQRTEPLQDLDRILYKVETDFEEKVELIDVEPEKLMEQACLEKKQSLMEAKVKKLCNLLDETIERTKQKEDKKKALAFEEEEKAHTESETYNPVGWLGMPIPYWPYKLGLGQEYKCEICTKAYWGKKAFERHLEEWLHKDGLRRLEIQGTEKFNEEAKQMWKRSIPKRQNHETEAPPGVAIPPPEIKTMLERTAQFLAKEGMEVEKRIVAMYEECTSFKFLNSSDPYNPFYQHKITEYRGGQATTSDPDDDDDDSLAAEFRVVNPTLEIEKFTCRVPEGITAMELDIIKLTAQFWSRFGRVFWEGFRKTVVNDPEFEFMDPKDHRFSLFGGLIKAYSNIYHPSKDPKEKLRKKTADMETVVENCLHRLQWDGFQKKSMENKRATTTVRVNESLSPQQLGALSEMMNRARRPQHPMPERPNLKESDLVPEDEFLAQHPGRGTMRIYIPLANDALINDAYIDVMVPSLLENVAELKERIALTTPFPATKQKLSGKTGVLNDHMSLAYYNVGPQDFLTLTYFT